MHIHGCKQTPKTPPTTSDEESSGSSDDGDMKKKKGNRAMGKKKYPKAVKWYTKAIKIDPENPTYFLNRAIANSALELWKAAEEDAASAVELGDPPSAKSHYQLARARLRRERYGEARSALQAGLSANPSEAALLQLSKELEAACRISEDKSRKAEEAKSAPSQGPSGARALLEQARSAYSAGSVEQAVSLLQSARAPLPAEATKDEKTTQINVLSLLGKASMRLRQWEASAEAFQGVVDIEEVIFSMDDREEREALSSAYNNLGIARKNSGKMREAVEALNEAYLRATNGDDQVATHQAAQILQNLAQCLIAQKRPQDAQKMYCRALEIGQRILGLRHTTLAITHMAIARCLRDQGLIREAIESYAKAMEIWMDKSLDEQMKEMPEVPSKERLAQLQQQCKAELAQLVIIAEQVQKQESGGGAEASEGGYPTGAAPAAALAPSPET